MNRFVNVYVKVELSFISDIVLWSIICINILVYFWY